VGWEGLEALDALVQERAGVGSRVEEDHGHQDLLLQLSR
jgi:hypothetical protein